MLDKLKAAVRVLTAPTPKGLPSIRTPIPPMPAVAEPVPHIATIPQFPSSWASIATQFKLVPEEPILSALSVLAFLGKDVKKVFVWLGSQQGQQVIATGEQVVESVYPAADGIILIANAGLREIIKIESIAVAAGAPAGSGVQKSAAVVASLTPEILSYAEQHGFAPPTAAKIQEATNALVAFMNAFEAAKAV